MNMAVFTLDVYVLMIYIVTCLLKARIMKLAETAVARERL
jgi:hypothetical protein